MARSQAVYGNATGTFLVGIGQGGLVGASLFAGGAAATLIVREGSGAGRVLAQLAAAANSADHFDLADRPVAYQTQVHVTLTGAGASFVLYQE